jgi:hypothetical protein
MAVEKDMFMGGGDGSQSKEHDRGRTGKELLVSDLSNSAMVPSIGSNSIRDLAPVAPSPHQ